MSKKLIQEVEEILVPYVKARFNIEQSPLGEIAKALASGYVKRYEEFVTWQARAFVRCIISTQQELNLNDIADVIFSEAYNMMEFTPVRNAFQNNLETLAASKIILEAEIHNWFLYLEEKEMLLGEYNRFTGYFTPAKG
ncbi:MAG: hypothetical protein U9O98_00160 [Asgard group archaeon]|nr:hypothetical protein [Asgard group archaeon]